MTTARPDRRPGAPGDDPGRPAVRRAARRRRGWHLEAGGRLARGRRSPTRRGASSTPARATPCWSCTRSPGTPTPPAPPGRGTPAPAGGTASSGRARRSTPTATSSSARTCSAAARAPPGRRRPGADGRRYGSRFPVVTIRDQVAVEVALADQLGIERWAAVVGGSMGGMRVLEWCVGYPDRVRRAVVLAVGAAATAEQIALCSLQVRAIRSDPAFAGRRLLRHRDGPGRRPGHRPGDRPGQLPHRPRAPRAVRPDAPGDEDPSRAGGTPSSPTSSTTATSSPSASTPTPTSC